MADVKVDSKEVRELERIFGTIAPRELKKSMRRALSRTRTGARSETSKEVRKTYNIQARRLKKDVILTRPNYTSMSFRVIGRKKPIGLINFRGKSGPPRQVRAGVSVAVKQGGRKTIKHAFIARVDGMPHVFTRYLAPGRKSGRLPIRRLGAPSAADMFGGVELADEMVDLASDRFSTELERHLKYLLGR